MPNFTVIDEEFICENCGNEVKKLGYTCRDHCNKCLCSKHVDKNPGDRDEDCHGLLEPIDVEINSKKGYVIIYKCKKCGMCLRPGCPALTKNPDGTIAIDTTMCNGCGLCAGICKFDAIEQVEV
mgnify:CR=1 FL=1